MWKSHNPTIYNFLNTSLTSFNTSGVISEVLWESWHVTSLCVRSKAIGRPTLLLRPMTVAFFFSRGSLYDSMKHKVASAEVGRLTICISSYPYTKYVKVVNIIGLAEISSSPLVLPKFQKTTLVGIATSINILERADSG